MRQNDPICAARQAGYRVGVDIQNGGSVRAFSWTAPVTQRHTFDRHRAEAGLRFSTVWTGLPEIYGWLVEVLAETAFNGLHGSSCWNLRAKPGG